MVKATYVNAHQVTQARTVKAKIHVIQVLVSQVSVSTKTAISFVHVHQTTAALAVKTMRPLTHVCPTHVTQVSAQAIRIITMPAPVHLATQEDTVRAM